MFHLLLVIQRLPNLVFGLNSAITPRPPFSSYIVDHLAYPFIFGSPANLDILDLREGKEQTKEDF